MQYSLDVFAYNGSFLITNIVDDDDFIEETGELEQEYIQEGLDDMLYYSKGRLFIGTMRKSTAPVKIDILPEKPNDETLADLIQHASQVGICGFQAFSPKIALQIPLTEDLIDLDLKIGTYQVMVFYNNLDKQYDYTTGDDSYHLIFYPGDLINTKLIKTYIPKPPRYISRD